MICILYTLYTRVQGGLVNYGDALKALDDGQLSGFGTDGKLLVVMYMIYLYYNTIYCCIHTCILTFLYPCMLLLCHIYTHYTLTVLIHGHISYMHVLYMHVYLSISM